MKIRLALLALAMGASQSLADCPLDRIETALASPLDGMTPVEREVSETQSTEGGVWKIYREADGRLHTIIRIDAGESGRNETRLSVVNRQTYGIASTRIDYIRHAFVEEGPFAIARRTTDYYFYCGGTVYVPGENGAMVDLTAYPKAAAAAQQLMVLNRDVAGFTKGLAR